MIYTISKRGKRVGRSKRGSKEFTREQKLINENKVLKRQVASMRKQMARLDLDRLNTAKELIEDAYQEDRQEEGLNIIEQLKKEWACKGTAGCEGYLEIVLYNKITDTWYYRSCTHCNNRTKSQRYVKEQVRGIIKNG